MNNKLLVIPISLVFLIILEISISSLVIHQNTSDLIYKSVNNTGNSKEVLDCYNKIRHFNFWYGIMSCVNLAIFTFLVIIFYILEFRIVLGDNLPILLLGCIIEGVYFMTGLFLTGFSLFRGECQLLKGEIIWIITCVTFSLSMFVTGVPFLTYLGFTFYGSVKSDNYY